LEVEIEEVSQQVVKKAEKIVEAKSKGVNTVFEEGLLEKLSIKEGNLRDEKKQLREKEKQLRDEKILLLVNENSILTKITKTTTGKILKYIH